jgi:glycosyltransferase involved in cell wall biosynthesis
MKKVSIITSVYNGERFIDAYMNSVLRQTYRNIQLIIVNDGSTDKSEERILSYTERLREKGIEFYYKRKENGGQASAINEGLKIITGDFVTWPDIDDQMHDNYIDKKVSYMEMHPEIDYLITQSAIINIDSPDVILGYTWEVPPKSNEELLYRIITNTSFWYEPGNFFVSVEVLKCAIPTQHIYDLCGKWSGAQIQMMLPIIYYGRYGYLRECLYDYIIHESNDHNKYKEKNDIMTKYDEGRKVLKNTIEKLDIPMQKRDELIRLAEIRMTRMGMYSAFNKTDYDWYKYEMSRMPEGGITGKDKIKLLILKYHVLTRLCCMLKKLQSVK